MKGLQELCNEPTKDGKACNMLKGHEAPWHRYKPDSYTIDWRIKSGKDNRVLEFGRGRKELGYAMTLYLRRYDKLVIEIES